MYRSSSSSGSSSSNYLHWLWTSLWNNEASSVASSSSVVVVPTPVAVLLVVTSVATTSVSVYWWWSSIRRQLQLFRDSSIFGKNSKDPFRMIRCVSTRKDERVDGGDNKQPDGISRKGPTRTASVHSHKKIRMLDLDPAFQQKYGTEWKLLSLGDYLSSLQPYLTSSGRKNANEKDQRQHLPDWMEREMRAALVAALIRGLGPHLGAAVLPTLTLPWLRSTIHRLAQRLAPSSAKSKTHTTYENNNDDDMDQAGVPLSLSAMTCIAEFNYQRVQKMTTNSAVLAQTAVAALSSAGNKNNNNTKALLSEKPVAAATATMPTVTMTTTALEKLRLGEVGFHPHSFGTATVPAELNFHPDAESTHGDPLVPNPFIFTQHWTLAIEAMEMLIIQEEERQYALQHQKSSRSLVSSSAVQQTRALNDTATRPRLRPHASNVDCLLQQSSFATFYDPNSKDMPPPVPIDERWLPDLHLGWGSNVQCTHTHRQVLQNRLLGVVLNRLASNYARLVSTASPADAAESDNAAADEVFVVQMDPSSPTISTPSELIQALIDMGHVVETCVRTHPTTFGVALCVREHDNSSGTNDGCINNDPWSHIPLAYFVQNGYSDAEANEAFVCLPHSGLNLEIHPGGPLLKQGISIQHFMAIDGLCGWHSNHHVADVPWIQTTDCSPIWLSEHNANLVVDSVRMAACLAIVINAVGTKYDLPYGGYGLTGVCNDSAALIEYAMTGKTNVYPLTFNGKFAMHNLRVARDLRLALQKDNKRIVDNDQGDVRKKAELATMDRLIGAIMMIPSDTNTLPSEAMDQCRRQLHCHPKEPPFTLLVQSRKVIESVQQELVMADTSCAVIL